MDHRTFMANLPPETKAQLTARANGPGLWRLMLYVGFMLGLGTGIALGVPGWPAMIVAQGVLIVFLFTLLHETAHLTAFATPGLNRWVGRFCGFALLLPPEHFRYFHFAHHRHTHDPENDPELRSPKPETWSAYLWHLTGWTIWRDAIVGLIKAARGASFEAYVPDRGRAKVVFEARVFLALYAGLAFVSWAIGSAVLLWVWVVPAVCGQPFLRAYLLAEHARCPHVANMFENTRTTFTGAVIRFLAWNMPYHAEHHAYPAVPFHRLPDLHALVRDELQVTAPGYGAFHVGYVRIFRAIEVPK